MLRNYSLAVSKEKIQTGLGKVLFANPLDTNYNISSTNEAFIIKAEKPLRLEKMEWGLIPQWSKDGINSGNLLSTAYEGISSKISFRIPIRKRRCLVIADSFYLWKNKSPYRVVRRDGEIMCWAGVWENWSKDGRSKNTFSIISGPSNKEVFQLGSLMPVLLLTEEERERWLFSADLAEALKLLKPSPNGLFNIYRVSDKISDPTFNRSEIHTEVPDIKTLFD